MRKWQVAHTPLRRVGEPDEVAWAIVGLAAVTAPAVARVRNIRYLLGAGLTLDDVRGFEICLDGDMSTAKPSPAGLRIARERLAAALRDNAP